MSDGQRFKYNKIQNRSNPWKKKNHFQKIPGGRNHFFFLKKIISSKWKNKTKLIYEGPDIEYWERYFYPKSFEKLLFWNSKIQSKKISNQNQWILNWIKSTNKLKNGDVAKLNEKQSVMMSWREREIRLGFLFC